MHVAPQMPPQIPTPGAATAVVICCNLFFFSVVVTDLLANAAINISHFLCSESEEKCIPCKTAAIKLHIRIYCNINLNSFFVCDSSISVYSAYFAS